MDVLLVVAPVFALIVVGYLAATVRLLSEGSHRTLAEFAFGIAVPALLLKTLATARFPAVSPLRVWAAYFGALAVTWMAATTIARLVLRRPPADGATISMGAVYGNIVMLGIPLSLAAFGPQAAGPMALILAINTPILWLVGTMQIGYAQHGGGETRKRQLLALASDLVRNPIVLGIAGGLLLRIAEVKLHPIADGTLSLIAQAGVPASLVALGASLRQFRIQGQSATLVSLVLLKLLLMPLVAWWLAFEVFALPPTAASVVVLFAAMPAGANVYLFANRYRSVVDSVSGAIALGTLISALTASALIGALPAVPK